MYVAIYVIKSEESICSLIYYLIIYKTKLLHIND